MINYKRPKKPHGFPPKKIILLLQRIATKVSSGDELSSSEFKSYWGDYNRHSAPDLGINLPIALTQYLQNDLLVSC